MNKYNKATVMIDGREVELHNRVFIPKEIGGRFRTHEGREYIRDKTGSIRRAVPKKAK